MIDLLLVDDHRIFRAGMVRLVSDEPDIRVAGEAGDGATALAMIRARRYDVVLMDINMGARNGLDTLTALRAEQPRLPVIMLSMYVESQYARLALKLRANAYLSKDTSPEELMAAVRHVAGGGVYVSPGFDFADNRPATAHAALTPREMEVMLKIARGVPLTEIGSQLCLSVKTVGSHRSRILVKLGLASNAELVQYAMRQGLVD
ncbi:MAG: response regulator transcription factor [Burkholderiales bacterium]|nr:response regulator transcription factor [Burkholderiales bacterium]MDE1925731.1 response regulator transcription factor [Burkholderiales bacterium]MDE2157870.1 response regulator transcription factor [Burkholderiales bacterium]MDE2502567.1 response regulator transcription factor [Burkholderiales bacterium]